MRSASRPSWRGEVTRWSWSTAIRSARPVNGPNPAIWNFSFMKLGLRPTSLGPRRAQSQGRNRRDRYRPDRTRNGRLGRAGRYHPGPLHCFRTGCRGHRANAWHHRRGPQAPPRADEGGIWCRIESIGARSRAVSSLKSWNSLAKRSLPPSPIGPPMSAVLRQANQLQHKPLRSRRTSRFALWPTLWK